MNWGRRYLTLDRYMSGSFLRVFLWTLAITGAIFLLIWLLAWMFFDWSLGYAFIQFTNPDSGTTSWGWLAVVATNLFGLFVLNGVVLTLLVNWVSNRKERHTNGEARYEYVTGRPFSVIIGGHKMVVSLARDLIESGRSEYVLIQTTRDPERLRKEIYAEIRDERQARNVIIYAGERTSWHEMMDLHLDKAQEVYIIGESFYIDASSHDALNMQCWKLINDHITERRAEKIPCHIMFEYQSTFSAFQVTDLSIENSAAFHFIPFSIYETWAQQVLVGSTKRGADRYLPIDGKEGITYASPERVHLVVTGMSKMGVALAIEAAHIAHYPNFDNPGVGRPRTLITFIDRNAHREMLYLMGRYRELFRLVRWRYVKAPVSVTPPSAKSWDIYDDIKAINERGNKFYRWNDPCNDSRLGSPYYGNYLGDGVVDIDFEFIEGDVAQPSIQKYITDACADALSRTTLAICFPVAAESMSAALYMNPSVYESAYQILVQQAESGALVDAVRKGMTGEGRGRFGNLRPFGMVDKCDYFTRADRTLPKLVAYAYATLDENTSIEEKYKSFSSHAAFMKAVDDNWKSITQSGGKSIVAKRWSNVYCAHSFATKRRSARGDFGDRMIEQLARVEHNRWVMEQLLLGVQPVDKTFAGRLPVKDPELKKQLKSRNIHPDIISNDMLGEAQKYDKIICRIIPFATILTYMPNPIDTSGVNLPEELLPLVEEMARNVHEVWAQNRLNEGWTYGPARDDIRKTHPCLVPYDELPESEKDYDRATSQETLKMILKSGFTIGRK